MKQTPADLQGYGVIFYGDSLMETWRGTDHCRSCDAVKGRATCRGSAAVFERYFKRHRPAIMGIGGDQVANLIWRLQHGQMPQRNKVRGSLEQLPVRAAIHQLITLTCLPACLPACLRSPAPRPRSPRWQC
jgi:hypothetical protein